MPKKDEDYVVSETGNWNVASDYAKLKIMKPLYNCDIYENIAKFGYDSFGEQLEYYGVPEESLRLMGMDRLVHELLKLIDNSKFAMKKGKSKETLIGFEDTLRGILKFTPKISSVKVNQIRKTRVTKIDEKLFNLILNKVLEIKSKINEPLNMNDLIFTGKEDFDPQAYKKQVIEQATTRG